MIFAKSWEYRILSHAKIRNYLFDFFVELKKMVEMPENSRINECLYRLCAVFLASTNPFLFTL